MSFIDIIICIPLVWGLYKGFTKGLIVEAATILAFGLGVWGGVHLSGHLAGKVAEWFDWQSPYLPIVAFAITFLLIIIIIFLLSRLIQRFAEGMALGAVNKIGGAVFGALKFAMVLSVVIFVIDAIEKSYPVISFEAKENSLLYRPLGKVAPAIIPAMDTDKMAAMMSLQDDVQVDVNVKLKEK